MEEGLIMGQSIIGYVVDDWTVKEYIGRSEDDTGGSYSLSYLVEKDGVQQFMKVYDFNTYTVKNPNDDSADVMFRLLDHFRYERDLNSICRNGFFDKVCYAIGAGSFPIVINPMVTFTVHYLIFNKAEEDVRVKLSRNEATLSSCLWKFRMLHHMAVGMKQLYMGSIFHQDIKPSNVLCFPCDEFKIGDLGRSYTQSRPCPFSSEPYWGDKRYMAPEISYRNPPPNLRDRAQMTDLYLFGSLIFQIFTGQCYNAELYSRLDSSLHSSEDISYLQVLPILQEIHTECMIQFDEMLPFPEEIKTRLVQCVSQLCSPDYTKRHHPQFTEKEYKHLPNLEKLISTFDYLEDRMSIHLNSNG